MKQSFRKIMGLAVVFLLVSGSAWALDFGKNITIDDKNGSSSSWDVSHEDEEVEPGMETGQKWDLEGFFLDGSLLTMIGGYDFKGGEWGSGDIFLDVNGDAKYGDIHGTSNGNTVVADTFGYDYVIDLNSDMSKYDVYKLDGGSSVITTWYKQNQGSSPWRYNKKDGDISIFSGDIGYQTLLTDAMVGFSGDNHNAVTVDLRFLGFNQTFISHFTMGCGNDNLMGSGTTPTPEPGTMVLLGIGFIGLAAVRRNRMKRA